MRPEVTGAARMDVLQHYSRGCTCKHGARRRFPSQARLQRVIVTAAAELLHLHQRRRIELVADRTAGQGDGS